MTLDPAVEWLEDLYDQQAEMSDKVRRGALFIAETGGVFDLVPGDWHLRKADS